MQGNKSSKEAVLSAPPWLALSSLLSTRGLQHTAHVCKEYVLRPSRILKLKLFAHVQHQHQQPPLFQSHFPQRNVSVFKLTPLKTVWADIRWRGAGPPEVERLGSGWGHSLAGSLGHVTFAEQTIKWVKF